MNFLYTAWFEILNPVTGRRTLIYCTTYTLLRRPHTSTCQEPRREPTVESLILIGLFTYWGNCVSHQKTALSAKIPITPGFGDL